MKKIFVLFGMCAICLVGCNKEIPPASAVQTNNAPLVQPMSESNPVVHNEQLTIPDRPISKKTGQHKF